VRLAIRALTETRFTLWGSASFRPGLPGRQLLSRSPPDTYVGGGFLAKSWAILRTIGVLKFLGPAANVGQGSRSTPVPTTVGGGAGGSRSDALPSKETHFQKNIWAALSGEGSDGPFDADIHSTVALAKPAHAFAQGKSNQVM